MSRCYNHNITVLAYMRPRRRPLALVIAYCYTFLVFNLRIGRLNFTAAFDFNSSELPCVKYVLKYVLRDF